MTDIIHSIYFKLSIMAICAALFWLGGFCWKPARRFIMPFICALDALLATFCPIAGVGMLLSMAPLSLGYGVDSPLRHVFGDGWGRGAWGLLVAMCLSIPLLLTHHLGVSFGWLKLTPLLVYVELFLFLALNFTLENALKNIPQWIGDPIIGLGFSSIVLLIR